MDNIISIYNILGSVVNTREASQKIKNDILEKSISHVINIDFKSVEFISRSFADQFYKDIYELRSIGYEINLSNLSFTINKSLSIVSETQNVVERKTENFYFKKFTSFVLFEKSLLGL